MELVQIITLALVQGLTEFLPVSSSAHLILAPYLLGWEDQGQAFDVAVHVGTLAAVVSYFHRDLLDMLRDWTRSLFEGRPVGASRLAWSVIWGTAPAGFAGVFVSGAIEQHLRSPLVIAAATVGFGLALWWAVARATGSRDEHSLTWRDVLFIGFAQALALIPGTSRSGITITAGLLSGLSPTAAARFSFLLSIPIITAAGGLHTLALIKAGAGADWTAIGIGAVCAAVSAFACIHAFLVLLERVGMMPFVIYRLVLGAFLVVMFI